MGGSIVREPAACAGRTALASLPRARIPHRRQGVREGVHLYTWGPFHGACRGRGSAGALQRVVDGLERVVSDVGLPLSAPARTRMRRLRARAATTPGRLRLLMAGVVLATLVAGLVLAGVTAVRSDAVDAVVTRDEPLMVEVDGLYASLSDADATAA